jgi:hypothetical protein
MNSVSGGRPEERQLFNGVELPCFMSVCDGAIDGWRPGQATGSMEADFAAGRLYADMAVKHARDVKNPHAISFIIASMNCKAVRGEITYGGYEQGFLDRLAFLACAGSLN